MLPLVPLVLAETLMELKSPAFDPGGVIPARFTCEGANVSPPLQWSGAPAETRSFALIVDDPDAPGRTWLHWTAWDIPATATKLAEGEAPRAQGTNDFRAVGYGGPCPPRGHGAHRYFFRLYALDRAVTLAPGATRQELDKAMEGHVLAKAEVMGKFWRDK
ncbi:MAG: YbhB/YbcL family Raf kinase inhibitor-like protein [Myxococcota bacterium]